MGRAGARQGASRERSDALLARLLEVSTKLDALDRVVTGLSGQVQQLQSQVSAAENAISASAAYGQALYRLQSTAAEAAERALLLQGRIAARGLPERLHDLADAEFRATSQWGEDGILEWLVQRLPSLRPRFIEFGVGTFREANCRFLMQNRNWRGLVIDGSPDYIAQIARDTAHWMYDLTAVQAFITRENVNDHFKAAGFEGEIGILSIDINGNDYWVLDVISIVNPQIIICEYNSVLGDTHALTIPYKADRTRFDEDPSGLYYGASILALISLARRRGYTFIGTNSHGCNAFFVRSDLAHLVTDRLDAVTSYPSRFRDSRNARGELTFVGGRGRLALIAHLPVVDVESNETIRLRDIGSLYSDDWLTRMEAG